MIRAISLVGLGCVAALACTVRATPEDGTGSSSGSTGVADGGEGAGVPTTGGAGGTGPQTGTGGATGTGDSTATAGSSTGAGGSTGGDTCGFICGSTGEETEGRVTPCDLFKQDCPEGEKCSAYAEGGGSSWNASKCVPVQGDGQPGEPCTAQDGGLSGLDDCAKEVMCWNVDEMNQGTCVELCAVNESDPTCSDEENFFCACGGECLLALCLPHCDPLIQDCAGDDVCISVYEYFSCALDVSGDEGQVFDPCEYANACDEGLMCVGSYGAEECDQEVIGCCLPFCDVTDPGLVCPGVGQMCLSVYEQGMATPGYEKVGLCQVP